MLEVEIVDEKIVPLHSNTFLKEIGIPENPKGFRVQEHMTEDFQMFLHNIGYNCEFKAKEFKKSVVPGL